MADVATLSGRAYINGQWVHTDDEIEVVNPATGEVFARVCALTRNHVEQALRAAHDASPTWRSMTARDRGTLLHRVADELARRKLDIARTITLENGKPLAQSEGEVAMGEDHLRWFAEEGRRAYGRTVPQQSASKRHLIIKTPIGPVGAIAPWNFPLLLSIRKVAPAMAAGCPVVLKPAKKTPLSAVALAECMEAAGVPAGVFQLVIGDASMIADEFLSNSLCRKVTFTGSTEVGRLLIRKAAETIKPLSLELGGHAPVLIFDDCDLDAALRETVIAKFRNTGQSCIAANRVYVQKSIYAEFMDKFTTAVRKLKVGNGLEPGIEVGPLIGKEALDSALRQVEDAVSQGGTIRCGGHKVSGLKGYFLEPTVIDSMRGEALCMREETFAPMAPVVSFGTEAEGIERANASCYGLSAYVMSRDVGRILRCAEQLEAGTIGVNDGAPSTSQCPFGGIKQSGWGRELGSEGMDAFLETKHVSIAGV
ncbi:MAG: succinate-semialdehyde dehydrogenase (NADP(+)) [Acidobacteria bacterium]|nr:MAG: succinate-semialdehyde dehydrogenase (NADP(+)) [Acidobacteriota bacterium]